MKRESGPGGPRERRRVPDGFQQHDVSLRVPAGAAGVLFPAAPAVPPGAERRPAGLQPAVLRLGRAAPPGPDGRVHCRELLRGPAGGAGAALPPLGDVGRGGGEPGPPGLVQVRGVPGGKPGSAGPSGGAAGGDASHRHLFFHLPGDELRAGRLPGRGPGGAVAPAGGPLHRPLSPAGGGAHRPVYHRGGGDRLPPGDCGGRRRRRRPVLRGPCEKDAAGQRPGAGGGRGLSLPHRAEHGHGLAGGPGLHRADLLRFLRLFGHGHRPGPGVRVSLSGKFQLSLSLPLPPRSSGGAGTSPCPPGSGTMCTSPWAGAAAARRGRRGTSWRCGC